jgi:hypothetical protein
MDSLDISKLFVELMDINYPWVLATHWALGWCFACRISCNSHIHSWNLTVCKHGFQPVYDITSPGSFDKVSGMCCTKEAHERHLRTLQGYPGRSLQGQFLPEMQEVSRTRPYGGHSFPLSTSQPHWIPFDLYWPLRKERSRSGADLTNLPFSNWLPNWVMGM